MKAKGVYVYGVWLPQTNDGSGGWLARFSAHKKEAQQAHERAKILYTKDAVVKRVYIPAPKETR